MRPGIMCTSSWCRIVDCEFWDINNIYLKWNHSYLLQNNYTPSTDGYQKTVLLRIPKHETLPKGNRFWGQGDEWEYTESASSLAEQSILFGLFIGIRCLTSKSHRKRFNCRILLFNIILILLFHRLNQYIAVQVIPVR